MPAGIPTAIRDLTLGFAFDDLARLSRLLDEHDEPGRLHRPGSGDGGRGITGLLHRLASAL